MKTSPSQMDGMLLAGVYEGTVFFVDVNNLRGWLRIDETLNVRTTSGQIRRLDYFPWVQIRDVDISRGCGTVPDIELEEATFLGIACRIAFPVQTQLRSQPDNSAEAVGIAPPRTFVAAEQFERPSEGFRWWRISRDHHALEGGLWVREDFVTETDECSRLPALRP